MAYAAGSVVLKIDIDDSSITKSLSDIKSQIKDIGKDLEGLSKSFKNTKMTNLKDDIKDARTYLDTLKQIKQVSKDIKNTKLSNISGNSTNKSTNKTNSSSLTKEDGAKAKFTPPTLQAQLAQQNGSGLDNLSASLNKVFGTGMKVLKIATSISAVYAVLKTAVNTYVKALKTTVSILSNSVKYFTEMNVAAAKFVYTFSGAKTVINALSSGFSYLKSKIQEAFSIDNIKEFLNSCTELGSALTEVQNIIDKTFGSDAGSISSWSQSLLTTFGLTELESKNMVGNIGAILDSAGMASDQMSVMSKNITLASADMASFYNKDVEDTFAAMRSAMTGQVRPMLQFGVSTHAATLQEYLLKNGIDATYSSLSYASKELVRYNYMMETLSGIMGDFTDTQWTYANQQRTLTQEWTQFKTVLGNSLKTVLTPVLIVLRAIVSALTQAAQALYSFISGLGIFQKWNITLDQSANTAEGLSDLYDDMGDSISSAAKEAKKAVSSFDELHKLNDATSSSSSGSGVDITGLLPIWDNYPDVQPQTHPLYEATQNLIKEIKSAWDKADFTDLGKKLGNKINEGLTWLKDHWGEIFGVVKNFGVSLATFLNGLIKETDFSLVAQTLQNSIKTILWTAFSFITNFNSGETGIKVGDFINGLFKKGDDGETALSLFAKTISTAINNISNLIINAMKTINPVEIGTEIARSINIAIENINLGMLGEAIGSLASILFQALSTAFQNIKWKELGQNLNNFIKGLFKEDADGNTFLDYAGDMAVSFINGVIEALQEVLSGDGLQKANEEIKQFFQKLRDGIDWGNLASVVYKLRDEVQLLFHDALSAVDWTTVVLVAMDLLSDAMVNGIQILLAVIGVLLGSVVEAILKIVGQLAASIVDAIVGLVSSIVGLLKSLKDLIALGVQNLVVKIVSSIVGLFEKFNTFKDQIADGVKVLRLEIEGKFKDIAEWFKSKFDSAAKGIKEAWSGVVDFFKGIWEGIVSIFDGVGDWFKSKFESAFKGISDAWSKFKSAIGFGDDENVNVNVNGTPLKSSLSLPHLATGGYVGANMPQLAVIGDNRSQGEIVAPEGKMYEVMTNALTAFFGGEFLSALGNTIANSVQGYGGNGDVVIPLSIDGSEIARIMLSQQDIEMARRG